MNKKDYIKELFQVYDLIGNKKIQYFCTIVITGLALPLMQIFFAFAYKRSINAIEYNDYSLFFSACILFFLAIVIQCLIEPIANCYNGCLVNKILFKIRNKVYRHTIELPVSYLEKNHSGDIILRLTGNVDSFEPIFRGAFRDIMQSLFYGGGALISMLVINYKLALCSLFFSIISLIINSSFTKTFRSLGKLKQEQDSILVQSFITTYTCGDTAKMFCKEDILIDSFNSVNKQLTKTSMQIIMKEMIKENLNYIVSNISRMCVLIFGLVMVMKSQTDIGSVVGIITLQDGVTNMFISIGSFFANMQSNLASVARVFELLRTSPEKSRYDVKESSIARDDDIISFENVSFSYDRCRKSLDNISINIKENIMVAIVGPNGSGKSTIIKLLLGFYPPDGKITLCKKAFGEYKLSEIREKISYVSQQPVLFNATVFENISYGKPDAIMEEVIDAAKLANIHDFITSLEDGYQSIVGEDGVTMSIGQKQRIIIARALIKDAPIILFDEATSALDVENEGDIIQTLKNIKGKKTIIIVTHRLSSIQDADLIVVLKDGQIIDKGDHKYLLKNSCVYKKLYELQSV
ncbi:MAG: ABC transporter ATP-binding protein [Firmicutes bacterium]|nr:ABC transporter ATP-binding protein [Bacillota bacterium]